MQLNQLLIGVCRAPHSHGCFTHSSMLLRACRTSNDLSSNCVELNQGRLPYNVWYIRRILYPTAAGGQRVCGIPSPFLCQKCLKSHEKETVVPCCTYPASCCGMLSHVPTSWRRSARSEANFLKCARIKWRCFHELGFWPETKAISYGTALRTENERFPAAKSIINPMDPKLVFFRLNVSVFIFGTASNGNGAPLSINIRDQNWPLDLGFLTSWEATSVETCRKQP